MHNTSTVQWVSFSTIIACLFYLASMSNSAQSQDKGGYYYDYAKTEIIVLYSPGDEGGRMLAPLFGEWANDYGPRFHNIALSYVSNFEEIVFPLGELEFIADFLSSNNYKRFYFGPAWISDGKLFSFMEEKDYSELKNIWLSRAKDTPVEGLTKEVVEHNLGIVRAEDKRNGLETSEDRERDSLKEAIDKASEMLAAINKDENAEADNDASAIDDMDFLSNKANERIDEEDSIGSEPLEKGYEMSATSLSSKDNFDINTVQEMDSGFKSHNLENIKEKDSNKYESEGRSLIDKNRFAIVSLIIYLVCFTIYLSFRIVKVKGTN